MKRIVQWLLLACGALVAAAAITVLIAMHLDWNRAKPWLTRSLSQALARSVRVDGELRVDWRRDADLDGWDAWVPMPHVAADQVTVGNSAWAQAPVFGTAARVELDLALLPLLAHRVSIRLLRLGAPDAHLERGPDGRKNWTFDDAATTWHCTIDRIAIDGARFTFGDRARKIDVGGTIAALGESVAYDEQVGAQVRAARREVLAQIGPKATERFEQRADRRAAANRRHARAGRYAFSWKAQGTFRGQPFDGAGKLGGAFYLSDPEHPFPLLGDMHLGDTHVVLVGTLTNPADLDALDLRLWLAGPNLSRLYDIAAMPLPNSGEYAMEGRLVARFDGGGDSLRYENFTARIGRSDFSGDLRIEPRQPRPLLSGKVVSDELQFRDLAPLIGAGDDGHDKARKLLPSTAFRPQRWTALDADVEFTGDRVFRDSQLPIHKVDTHVVLRDGRLALEPLKFSYADGDVDATLRLDGRTAPIQASFDLRARGMQLKHLFASAGDDLSLGRADARAKLTASGDSVGALLGAANGSLRLLLDRGTISKSLLEAAGLNVLDVLVTKLAGDRQVRIDCAAAEFVARQGVFDARTFIVDTDIASLSIDGTVDLGRETLDLTVHPHSKGVRLLSLNAPLHVTGPFRDIDVSVDKKSVLARAATAIGLAVVAAPAAALVPLTSADLGNDDDNRCAALLERATAPAPGKSATTQH